MKKHFSREKRRKEKKIHGERNREREREREREEKEVWEREGEVVKDINKV